jgi:VanZ family protein
VSLWGPVVAYMALIFLLSSMTGLPAPPGGLGDKSAHLLEYAGLALLTLRALAMGRLGDVRLPAAIGTVAIALAYGLTDEIHQLFVAGRQCDVRDFAADAIGAGITAAAVWTWGIIRRSFGSASRRA